jgi:hypothetical protein
MGRPSKLTPELQDRICNALRAGNFIEPVCAVNGIDDSTFRRWMTMGADTPERKGRQPYRTFRAAVIAAQAIPEVALVNRTYTEAMGIPKTCGKRHVVRCPCGCGTDVTIECDHTLYVDADSRSREFLLSRKFPDRWGAKDRLEHSGPGGGPIQTAVKHVRFGGRYRKDGGLQAPADPAAKPAAAAESKPQAESPS